MRGTRIGCFSLLKSCTRESYLVHTRHLINDYWICQRTCLLNNLQLSLHRGEDISYFEDSRVHLHFQEPPNSLFFLAEHRKGRIYLSSMARPEIYYKQATINTWAQYKKIQEYWHLTSIFTKLIIKSKKIGAVSYRIKLQCRSWQAVIYYITISIAQTYHPKVQQRDWGTNLWDESRANTDWAAQGCCTTESS